MALSDGAATAQMVIELNTRNAEHYAALARIAEREESRLSSPRTFKANDTIWTYCVVDGEVVRIQGAETSATTLEVPSQIDGMPVVGLAPNALVNLESVEELLIPDSVVAVGGGAMRGCKNLRRISFPRYLADFDSSWLQFCKDVEELTLPGCWENIMSSIFDLPRLKKLHIGANTKRIESGAFQKSQLEEITVDEENEAIKTDGQALYSKDGKELIVLAVPSRSYTVLDGCERIARKAFSAFEDLFVVDLPDSVVEIAEFAFTRTSVESFVAPACLKAIREKAFFRCIDLENVVLNDGLEEIGNEAFASTALTALELPRTTQTIGRKLCDDTAVTYSGKGATFTVAKDALYLSLDEQGALYSTLDGVKTFVQIVEPKAEKLIIQEGTKVIGLGAGVRNTCIEAIKLPEGLQTIKREAFKGCRNLYWVEMPDSVTRIEDEAFLDTALQQFHMPANLTYFGMMAIVTYGAHHIGHAPTLREVEVPDSLSDRYFTVPGMLCARRTDGTARVIVGIAGTEEVVIPPEVTSIDEYAFNNARGIRKLTFSDRIHSIGMCGFALNCYVEHIHVDLSKPVSGHDHFDFYFPFSDRAMQSLSNLFGMMRGVDLQRMFSAYDQVITNGASLNGAHGDSGMSLYDQAQRILARMAEPIYMSKVHHNTCLNFLRDRIEDISVEIARRDDRRSFDTLLSFNFLNEDNLLRVIERVSTIQDAAMTGYLLEVRRKLFKQDIIDFDL